VDDASPSDDAERIVTEIGDPRVRVIRHSRNRGQAAGRNTGIVHTTGPLIMAVDCDDALAPAHVEKLVAALQESPDCVAAYADYQLFDARSEVLRFPVRDTRWLLREQWIPHPGTIVRRSMWIAASGYCEDEAFRAGNEDWEYFLRLAEVGLKAVRVPEPLYRYRQHGGSITSTQFACADHAMRELMYARHRALFDRHHMRRTFLAGGYRVSGKAFWQRRQHMRAFALLARSLWLSPSDFMSAVWRKSLAKARLHASRGSGSTVASGFSRT
jgi:glycosyltransferase involved in cell wall biosynthesis